MFPCPFVNYCCSTAVVLVHCCRTVEIFIRALNICCLLYLGRYEYEYLIGRFFVACTSRALHKRVAELSIAPTGY